MIDLTKKVLPDAVMVSGSYYDIQTDFNYWINFYRIMKSTSHPLLKDFDFLYKYEIPQDRAEGFQQLLAFYNQKSVLPRPTGHRADSPIYDFDIDSDLIYSAFLEQYGIDLICESLHLHWFKFLALFNGLMDTKLNKVMEYRSFDKNQKTDIMKDMEELKKAWQIETKLTPEEQDALDKFDALLK